LQRVPFHCTKIIVILNVYSPVRQKQKEQTKNHKHRRVAAKTGMLANCTFRFLKHFWALSPLIDQGEILHESLHLWFDLFYQTSSCVAKNCRKNANLTKV